MKVLCTVYCVFVLFGIQCCHSATPYSFNIEDFGADPTGRLPSAYSIQAALNKAMSMGGEVIIPPGTFSINQTLVVTNTVKIRGISPESSKLVGEAGSGYLLNVEGARGVVLENFQISSTTAATSCLSLYKAFIVTVNNIELENCRIGLLIQSTGNTDIMTVNIWAHRLYGVRMLDLNGDVFLDKIHINNMPNQASGVIGMYLSNVSGAKVTNSDIIGSQVGVYMDIDSTEPNPTNEWDQFLSVDCDTVGMDPWHINNAHGLQMSECWSGSFLSGTGVWLGPDVQQVSIVNHQWQTGRIGLGNNAHGVSVTGGIMGNVQTTISSSVAGEPTIVNLREF